VPTLALLETNRSAALFRTGEHAAAAAAARRALRRSAWLVEARENRGMALLCMGREEEAACEFRAAARRPLEEGEERLTCVGTRVTTPDDFGFTTASPGVYPPIGYPALPSKALSYVGYYDRLNAESNARSSALSAEYDALTQKLLRPDPTRSPASKRRGDDLMLEVLKVPTRPSFVAQRERAEAIEREIGQLTADTGVELMRIAAQCAPDEVCYHDRCQALIQQTHPVFLARQTELEGIVRAWWRDLHAEMQGYALAIGDDDQHAAAVTQIDLQGLAGWNIIIGGAVAWNGLPATSKQACLDPLPDPPVTDPTAAPEATPRTPCPPELDKAKAKLDLAKGKVKAGPLGDVGLSAGIEVKCSEVKAFGEAKWEPIPLLAGFGKLGYADTAQGGKLTIGFGAKGGAGPASFESGLQLTVERHFGGTNVDLAWKVGPTASQSGLTATSDVKEISLAKSVAPPQALPSFPAG
jgi:hypothetical protein